MAKPLLIKPIIKLLLRSNEINNIISNVNKLSNLDILNITRAKYDKKIKNLVARSIGISTKELGIITEIINHTPARKKAISGRNFLNEVSRHTGINFQNINNYKENLKYNEMSANEDNKINGINMHLYELQILLLQKTDGKYGLPDEILHSNDYFENLLIQEIILEIQDDIFYEKNPYDIMVLEKDKSAESIGNYIKRIVSLLNTGIYFENFEDSILYYT